MSAWMDVRSNVRVPVALERMRATEPDPRADAPWNAKR
jgi:hypothetical protein